MAADKETGRTVMLLMEEQAHQLRMINRTLTGLSGLVAVYLLENIHLPWLDALLTKLGLDAGSVPGLWVLLAVVAVLGYLLLKARPQVADSTT